MHPCPPTSHLSQVRISGGVYPDIVEADYLSQGGEMHIGLGASSTTLNSLVFKLSYYDFGNILTESKKQAGCVGHRGVWGARGEILTESKKQAGCVGHWAGGGGRGRGT